MTQCEHDAHTRITNSFLDMASMQTRNQSPDTAPLHARVVFVLRACTTLTPNGNTHNADDRYHRVPKLAPAEYIAGAKHGWLVLPNKQRAVENIIAFTPTFPILPLEGGPLLMLDIHTLVWTSAPFFREKAQDEGRKAYHGCIQHFSPRPS
ncbi:hypothetical protein TgHK011_009150 [Trichoderma gracile]|nr:hypothetical protein TgHK011_009150 [Trichoderma gracile]